MPHEPALAAELRAAGALDAVVPANLRHACDMYEAELPRRRMSQTVNPRRHPVAPR